MPITSFTCSSRQARTQRVHWMQASRFTAMAGWLRSGAGCSRCRAASSGRTVTPVCVSQSLSSPACSGCGTSAASSSSTRRWLLRARSLVAFTSMPSVTARQQLAASTRSPSTSTTQARQLPSGRRPSLWHRWGMATPWRRAACRMDSPSRASAGWPSSVKATVGSASAGVCVPWRRTPSGQATLGRRAFTRHPPKGQDRSRAGSTRSRSAAGSAQPGPGRRWTHRPSRWPGLAAWPRPIERVP